MNETLTFNDLPMVVAQLRDEVVGMKQMIVSLQSQNKPRKANTHIPMSVEEASAYLKMPMATLYMKLGNGSIPATKPGKRYCPRHLPLHRRAVCQGADGNVALHHGQGRCTQVQGGELQLLHLFGHIPFSEQGRTAASLGTAVHRL